MSVSNIPTGCILQEIFTYLSLPSDTIKAIRSDSEKLMEEKFKRNHSEFTDAKEKPEQTKRNDP